MGKNGKSERERGIVENYLAHSSNPVRYPTKQKNIYINKQKIKIFGAVYVASHTSLPSVSHKSDGLLYPGYAREFVIGLIRCSFFLNLTY